MSNEESTKEGLTVQNIKKDETPDRRIAEQLLKVELELSGHISTIYYRPPVAYVYDPIEYAFDVHASFVTKFCTGSKKILFLGMNPGPWGMSQTGVPFGEISMVRDWLKVGGKIGKPEKEQPDRLVTGFECTRSEVSGRRFWELFQDLCGTPDKFFVHAFLRNYCPVALMDSNGRNITPVELKGPVQKSLFHACDEALVTIVKLLRIETIVGIGKFAEKRAQTAVKAARLQTQVVSIPHPSPRALGNENWGDKAIQRMKELELLQYFSSD